MITPILKEHLVRISSGNMPKIVLVYYLTTTVICSLLSCSIPPNVLSRCTTEADRHAIFKLLPSCIGSAVLVNSGLVGVLALGTYSHNDRSKQKL